MKKTSITFALFFISSVSVASQNLEEDYKKNDAECYKVNSTSAASDYNFWVMLEGLDPQRTSYERFTQANLAAVFGKDLCLSGNGQRDYIIRWQ